MHNNHCHRVTAHLQLNILLWLLNNLRLQDPLFAILLSVDTERMRFQQTFPINYEHIWVLFMHIHGLEIRNKQENLNGRYHLEDLGAEKWINLLYVLKTWMSDVNWIICQAMERSCVQHWRSSVQGSHFSKQNVHISTADSLFKNVFLLLS